MKGKVYKGKEVLSGFAEAAYNQSRDSRKEKWIPSEIHHSKKQVIRIEEIKARKSKMKIKPMSKKVQKKKPQTYSLTLWNTM